MGTTVHVVEPCLNLQTWTCAGHTSDNSFRLNRSSSSRRFIQFQRIIVDNVLQRTCFQAVAASTLKPCAMVVHTFRHLASLSPPSSQRNPPLHQYLFKISIYLADSASPSLAFAHNQNMTRTCLPSPSYFFSLFISRDTRNSRAVCSASSHLKVPKTHCKIFCLHHFSMHHSFHLLAHVASMVVLRSAVGIYDMSS